MLNRLAGAICAALLGALICFYGMQILYSSANSTDSWRYKSAIIYADSRIAPETPEAKIADYTWWLSAFTLIIGVVGLGQILFLIRADRTARIMAEIAQAQTGKMGEWADNAAKQILIVARQTDIQEKQHTIGRLQFFAMHRPKIVLREAIIGSVLEGEQFKIIMHIANVGSTPGTIVHSTVNVRLAAGVQLIMSGSTVDLHNDLGQIRLAAGESKLIDYPKDDAPQYNADKMKMKSYSTAFVDKFIERRDVETILTGQLIYIDEIGTQRRTAFIRILKSERQRFYPVADEPDLDYSD